MYVYIIVSDYGESLEDVCYLTHSSALVNVSKLAKEAGNPVDHYQIYKLKLKF